MEKNRTAALLKYIAILICAIGLGAFLNHSRTGHKRKNPPIATVKTTPAKTPRKPTRDEWLAHTLLSDSILSIVQSYYVDEDRVSNRDLLTTALQALERHSDVRFEDSGAAIKITIEGQDFDYPLPADVSYQKVLELFAEISSMVDSSDIVISNVDPTDQDASGSVKLLNQMLGALDAHSALLSPEAYRELRQGTEGAFGGLGVLVGVRDNLLTVIKPLPRSPALRAGIRRNDKILNINGVHTYGFSLDDLVEHMRGDPGTKVELSLLREGAIRPEPIELRREIIHVDSVTSQDIVTKNSNVLHLTVENFSSRTSREVLNAIKRFKLRNRNRLDGLVLDLRSNPGGLLDQAVQLVDLFLPTGVIVSTKGRREEIESAGSGFDEIGFPIVTLINGDSASASEIVAGALQDHGRSIVIGQPSFGKGSVQTIFELPGERALKLTIARYFTPSGRSIQNIGIMPDIWLQPVFQTEENINLMGQARYRNERFLPNHLTVEDSKSLGLMQPYQKSFYLADEEPEDDGTNKIDRELDVGLAIIRKIKSVYKKGLPKENFRASHWLALAAPDVRQLSNTYNGEVKTWLTDKFDVDWTQYRPVDKNTDINGLTVFVKPDKRTLTPGESVNFHWSVENSNNEVADRSSLFIRSEVMGFDTKELLIGKIPPGSSRSGVFTVTIPTYLPVGSILLSYGLAINAWPVGETKTTTLQIQDREVAELSVTAVLDGESGGKVAGVLESGEEASVKVTVYNYGRADARDVDLALVNLAGSQIDLDGVTRTIDELDAGEEVTVYIPIKASKKIFNSVIGIGVNMASHQMVAPIANRVEIIALPSERQDKAARLIGH